MADLQNIIRHIHDLSHAEKVVLRTYLDGELNSAAPEANGAGHQSELVGLFANETEVLDRVMDSVYENRSRPLRLE